MKISIPYFELPSQRGHSVYRDMLVAWQYKYIRSGTTLPVCLLTDRATGPIPEWRYEIVVLEDDTPAQYSDVLHKVGWLKHQAYDVLGRTLVMDLDAFPRKNLDYLAHSECSIAMTPDPGPPKQWPWGADWPAASRKYNAGVMIFDDPRISTQFRKLWDEKMHWQSKITYYDEVIFSALMVELDGLPLSDLENLHVGFPYAEPLDPSIIHFSGLGRKGDLNDYVQKQIRVPPHGV
jgi:hypothetical protein